MNKISTSLSLVGAMSSTDTKNFIDWVWQARIINCFDPDVLKYPRTIMATAEEQEAALLYIPVQPVLMFESIAPKPGISPRKEALALWKIGQMLEDVSKMTGFQEQYFLCKDDRVADICAEHGFTELVGYRLLKKKIAVADLPKEQTKC